MDAQKLLSCVFRISQKGRFAVGWSHIADVLAGANTEKIRKWDHTSLSTYGIGQEKPRREWVDLGRRLTSLGLTEASPDQFQTITLTEKGMSTLRQRVPVTLLRRKPNENSPALETANRPTPRPAKSGDIPCDEGLFHELRQLRKALADERNVPAYVIFSDVTLRHIARSYPASAPDFLATPGVGERKLTEFGAIFIATVQEWLATHDRQIFADLKPETPSRKERTAPRSPLSGTIQETLKLYAAGHTLEAIANQRGLSVTTIEGHFCQAIETGVVVDPADFYSAQEAGLMQTAFEESKGSGMKEVFETLGGKFSYGKLRLFKALQER